MSCRSLDFPRSLPGIAKVFFLSFLLAGCGGGGGTSTIPAKSFFVAGPIKGFGSVIVNGIHFDASTATVANDDDQAQTESDLKLGMMAEVEAGDVTVDSTGSHSGAKDIHFRSAVIGPVDAVDTLANTLVVLGQSIDVTPTTVFDDRLTIGLGSLVKGDIVQVYGMLDTTTGHIMATRVEPDPTATFYKLRGVVAMLDTTGHTFQIGTELISYSGLAADQVPADLANNVLVVVKLQTAQVNGTWVATKLKDAARHMADHDVTEIEGVITEFTSTTKFSVDGTAVDASNAKFPDGTAGVVLGARVEVEGSSNAGVIVAAKVSIESETKDMATGFELHGTISMLDTTLKTFVLRGVTVSYGGTGVVFKNGAETDLAAGRKVEVKGSLSTDGTRLDAATIIFES